MKLQRKIDKENIEDILGLTPLQKGMLFHYLKEPGGDAYFEQLSLRLKGYICVESIKKTWSILLRQNEMLRCIYRWDKLSEPMQVILKNHQLPIEIRDIANLSKEDQEKFLKKTRLKDRQTGLDISIEPLRIILLLLSSEEAEMIISNHHILYDGWSNGIILKEFLETYHSLTKGIEVMPISKNKFKEYMKFNQTLDKEAQRRYWESYLKEYAGKAEIPQSSLVQDIMDTEKTNTEKAKSLSLILEKTLTDNLHQLCRREKITIATLLSVAWGILLQRYNNTEDVVFGTTVSGRNPAIRGIENMVGLFINTIPLRVKLEDNEGILQLLKRIEGENRLREPYETTPLLEIKTAGGLQHQEELFDTLLVIENYPVDQESMKEKVIAIEISDVFSATNYRITVAVMLGTEMEINIAYRGDIYSRKEIEQLLCHYRNLLRNIALAPHQPVGELEIMTEEEKKQILLDFNTNDIQFTVDEMNNTTLHKAFEEVVATYSENIALAFATAQLTYSDLNEKANQLARVLVEKGINQNEIVGIMVERSLEMIVGLLAILKAGGAYLPIDPQYPIDRIQHMLEDSGTKVLLTQKKLSSSNQDLNTENRLSSIVILDDEGLYKGDASNLPNKSTPKDLAYIIYTSGSTGKPKGVMIQHRAIMNTLNWRIRHYNYTNKDTTLQIPTYCFDSSVEDIFTTLLSGGKLILLEEEKRLNIHHLLKSIEEHGVTNILMTPSFYHTLLKEENGSLKELRFVTLGGEDVSHHLVEEHFRKIPNVELYNEYGPTENSVCSTCHQIQRGDKKILIGKPIQQVQCYVVDRRGKIQPIGVAGELWLSGEGVAKGYLNRLELTAEKFISNPFQEGERVYRTGDLVRWLPDGNLEFLGRIDHQVKIRGYRIELGEIENHLLDFEGIGEAVVVPLDDSNNEKCLCCYLVGKEQIDISSLKTYLENHLPHYMIPSYFMELECFPLNQNGKIERNLLPKPQMDINSSLEYIPPQNEVEEKLVQLWQEVLGKEKIGIKGHFFQLGGHSIKAIQLINKIHKVLEVEVTIGELFDHPTIEKLGEIIEKKTKSSFATIERLSPQEFYQLSFGQQRLWILHQQNPMNVAYNMQGSITFNEEVNQKILSKVMDVLVERHEGLRTSFILKEEGPLQRVHSQVKIEIPLLDLSESSTLSTLKPEAIQQERNRAMREVAETIFNLEEAPLLKLKLVKLGEKDYQLMFCMHHIISDGWSMEILKNELLRLYKAYSQTQDTDPILTPLEIQYKDYAAWQNKELASASKMEAAKGYWKENLSKELPKGYIPKDFSMEGHCHQGGAAYRWMLEKEDVEGLNNVAIKYQTSLFTVLLTAFSQLLATVGQEKDVAIGIAGTAREHESLKNVIGFFVNTLVIRTKVDFNIPFSSRLKEVHREVMGVLEYQTYPLELIVRELKVKYPAISVFFNMLNIGESKTEVLTPFKSHHIETVHPPKFDLVVYVTEYANGLEFRSDYLKGAYKKETIAYVMEKYKQLLIEIVKNPEGIVKQDTANKPKRIIKKN